MVLEKDGEDQLDRSCVEVLQGAKKERNVLQTMKRRKANCTGHILRRNCLLKQIVKENTEGRIEVTGIRGKRCKQLLDYLKRKRGYYKLKEEALNSTMWETGFGRGYGTVIGQTKE